MKKALFLTCLVLLTSCSYFGYVKKDETAQMCATGTCPELLPTKGPKGWPVDNSNSFVWRNARAGTNFIADKTRPVRVEAAKFLIPENIVTNEMDYQRYQNWLQHKEEEIARPKPVYCYKTAADANCYNDPQPGQEERLIQ